MGVQICENDWNLFGWRARNELDVFFAYAASKFDNITSVLAFVVCIFGAVANSVHIVVLSSRFMPFTSVNMILSWIAVCDLVTVLSCIFIDVGFFFSSHPCSRIFGETLGQVRWLLAHVFVTLYTHSVSLWLVVAMAFVRYMALRRVRLFSRWMTPESAKPIVLAVFLVVLPFCAPNFLLYEPRVTYITDRDAQIIAPVCLSQNGTRYWLHIRNFAQMSKGNVCILLKIHLWSLGIGCKLLPCVLLAVLSNLLLCRLQRQATVRRSKFSLEHTRCRTSLRRWVQREKCTTVAITSIVIIFLITELPHGVLSVLSGVFTEDIYFHVYAWIGDILDLLSLINSSVNFVIMVASSSDYREAFRCVFRRSSSLTETTRNQEFELSDRGSRLSEAIDVSSRLSITQPNTSIRELR